MSERLLPVLDRRGRALRDLRVSVVDRCNFRCNYCMPKEVYGSKFRFLPHEEQLGFEEITRLVSLFVERGVGKIRLTGGEPLLRRDLADLVARLRPLAEVALTTNGSLLAAHAQALASAGLTRLTVSLDSLDDGVFRAMNDVDFPVERVLAGVQAARDVGLPPANINALVRRGVNDHTLLDLARHFKGTGHVVRFIEYMDVGLTNGWRPDQVVPALEIVERIGRELPLEPIGRARPNDVATRYRYRDGSGEIGVVASVTQPFCGDCTRGRLSTDGRFFTCLFSSSGLDLRALLRGGAHDEQVLAAIDQHWAARSDRYSEQRSEITRAQPRMEMSYLGG